MKGESLSENLCDQDPCKKALARYIAARQDLVNKKGKRNFWQSEVNRIWGQLVAKVGGAAVLAGIIGSALISRLELTLLMMLGVCFFLGADIGLIIDEIREYLSAKAKLDDAIEAVERAMEELKKAQDHKHEVCPQECWGDESPVDG